ncbi:hypothetical protein PILCRDRAFT_821283 [Piloderma croceum F 1598]|uniref:Phosphoesterase n=1 Tax=Piloderma croceum (strain F 1598) TaxID=765440 RepID=A0A0C3FA15_PILCF|nr:hypothetical protein PILCRDRAFT_821283 [Piloderma croceum F 1598]
MAFTSVTSAATTFSNMLLIILENTDYSSAIADPNLKSFASSGVLFSNWDAIGHPSQPNYIAITSGSTNGVTSDSTITINVKNVADLLETKGLTWKSYQENWPGNCFTGTESTDGLYFRKHNPFISYTDIQQNSTRCAKIVDASQLSTDISNGQLPTFAWYTPNINNDGHNTNVTFAGNWLKGFLASTSVTSHFDVVLVTFDETEAQTGPNHVYTAIAGKAVTNKGATVSTALTHYSVLATLEANFGLGNLGKNDVTATPFPL